MFSIVVHFRIGFGTFAVSIFLQDSSDREIDVYTTKMILKSVTTNESFLSLTSVENDLLQFNDLF